MTRGRSSRRKARDGPDTELPGGAASRYAAGVLDGSIPAGPYVRKACSRHFSDLVRAGMMDPSAVPEGWVRPGIQWKDPQFPFVISPDHARHAEAFYGLCRHWKGEWAGQRIRLEPFQQFIVWSVFGWVHRETALRRFTIASIWTPRKNGKTTFAAPAALYLLTADGEPAPEVYSAATKQDQARIVWEDAARMVRASPELRRVLKIFKSSSVIAFDAAGGKFVPLGADEHSLDGLNIHGAVVDELHAHRTRAVFDVLDTARGARRQPLIIVISTAGDSRSTVGRDEYDRAIRVLDGIATEDRLFAYVSSADPATLAGDGWLTERAWMEANPNYRVSVKPEYLSEQAAAARHSPAKRGAFLRYHLNVWNQSAETYLDPQRWDECSGPWSPAELELHLKGRSCFTALDKSARLDLTALVHLFPPEEPLGAGESETLGKLLAAQDPAALRHLWAVVPRFFIPADTAAEKESIDRVPYRDWARRGRITLTAGDVIDEGFLRRVLLEDMDRFHIRQLVMDPWGSEQFGIWARDEAGLDVTAFPQTIRNFAAPTRELLTLVTTRNLVHSGHEVLTWNSRNLAVKTDANQNSRPVKPDRRKSTARIDGMVALIMALGAAQTAEEESVVVSGVF